VGRAVSPSVADASAAVSQSILQTPEDKMSARARKALLLPLAVAAAGISAAGGVARERPPPSVAADPAPDTPATHNMMLVGEHTAFLSNLPMFDALNTARTAYDTPHRYQVIMEVTFTRNGQDVTQLYLDDRKQHPHEKMYTLSPARFILPSLARTDPSLSLTHFTAREVVRGHLERGGTPIPALDGVVVNVRRVIRLVRFAPAVRHPQKLTYILFGKGGELFLAHSITHPPDFDQIVAVQVDGHAFTDEELARGVEVAFPGRPDTPVQRIKGGESATGEFRAAGAHQALPLRVRAGTELYFEEGELRMPATFTDTDEEARSGFKG
jgi:hypothetical protein